jgi:alkyl sulfatase BDS1-like metallo-beta-lactamase superfamily hydrolase
MGRVRELSERLLRGEEESFHPFAPLFCLEEIGDRIAFVSSFANVLCLDTDEGLVLVDVGSFVYAGPTKELVRSFSSRPLHTAIYTHGHVDHVFGVALYEEEQAGRARVVGHRAVAERFDRYKLTGGYNACINARQFQTDLAWPTEFRYPDVAFEGALDVEVGALRIEIRHARGETDDHAWVWIPSERVLATGDLFIWATPNAGNPQKVQRYPREWAAALRQMAAKAPLVLCPGHGPPIFGEAAVRTALEETAELLETIVERTLALMNAGASLDTVLAEVRVPEHLLVRPYLRPVYDEPEFIVRNVWRLYGGWWDGDPSHLKPARAPALAGELARLAGGADRLAARAIELSRAGEHALACHLAETAARAAPADAAIRRARAEVYATRAAAETSLMARGIFGSAAGDEG